MRHNCYAPDDKGGDVKHLLSRPPSAVRSRGGWRGVHATYWARLAYWCGSWRQFARVDWAATQRVIVVCRGNVSRSPYAQARLGKAGCNAISAGIEVRRSVGADPVAQRVAAQRGIDLTGHRSQPIQDITVGLGDLLVLVDPAHFSPVDGLTKPPLAQLTLLGFWCHPVTPMIFDPFGRDESYYERCFDLIDQACETLSRKLAR